MKRHRRRARRLAFQALFMLDARREWDLELARQFMAEQHPPLSEEAFAYATRLLETWFTHREEIDRRLQRPHPRWRLERLRSEDRNILRLGLAELWYHTDVPPKVAINEWIEIAKRFSGEDAPRFVNAVLDRMWRERQGAESTGSDGATA